MKYNVQEAISLREKGFSYNEISKALAIPKGTLATWFKDMRFSAKIRDANIEKNKKIWAANLIAYNKKRSVLARQQWVKWQEEALKDVGKLSRRELLLVGTALYWAEGDKRANWNLVFCNSDPFMVPLVIKFFKEICGVFPMKLKGQVQIHPNISEVEAIEYWSKLTKIPKTQFMKSIYQVSRSSKRVRGNLLPYGTFRVRINDVKLVNKIKGWIRGLSASL